MPYTPHTGTPGSSNACLGETDEGILKSQLGAVTPLIVNPKPKTWEL